MKKILLVLTAVILSISVLASCSADTSGNLSKDNAVTEDYNATTGMDGVIFDKDESAVESPTTTTETDVTDGRKIIKNAQMTVETKTFDNFLATLEADIAKLKGYIEQKEISTAGNDYRSAEIVVRIPAEKLGEFMSKVSENGNVTYQNESAVDVTSSYNDIERHIKSLETEQERLIEIMEKADTLADILDIEERLTQIRYELDGYEQRLSSYDEQIAYSTVTLSVDEVEVVTVGEDDGFFTQVKEGFMGSVKAIAWIFRTLALVILSGSPFFILIGGSVAAIIGIVKLAQKKRKNK